MITSSIHRAFQRAYLENWWKLYVAVDIHGAIFPSTSDKSLQRKFFPFALETLKHLSDRVDIDLMIFSCSHREEIDEVLNLLKSHGVKFQFINENPEVLNDARGNYEFKPYYNVLIDDKAGFEPKEWGNVLSAFMLYPELEQPKV